MPFGGDKTNLFESVKDSVSARIAAQQYGIHVGHNGMCICPFHNDKNPSMKVDKRFHCFGCQADGDVISFTARLFNLSQKDAAIKLASDFGISYDARSVPKHKAHKINEAKIKKHQADFCFSELTAYRHDLVKWKEEYAPRSPDDEMHPLFLEAICNLDRVEYELDVLLSGSDSEKHEIFNDLIKRKKEKEVLTMEPIVKAPIYLESVSYAREHGELDQFRSSHHANIACKNEIDNAIARNFDGMHLKDDCAKDVLALYGPERVQMILAATVQEREWDGRFSRSNKDWAFSIPLPDTTIEGGYNRRYEYESTSHPAVLDGFISLVRKEVREMEQANFHKHEPHKKTKETEMTR